MSFDAARKIADAVLLEGYVLYPYRESSTKNRYRWTFGVLAPRPWSQAGGCEPWWLDVQCLIEGRGATLKGLLRFLQVERREVERWDDGGFRPAEALEVDGKRWIPWEEGRLSETEFDLSAAEGERVVGFSAPASVESETLVDASGRSLGRVRRTRAPVQGVIRVRVEPLDESRRPLYRASFRVENLTAHEDAATARAEVMRSSCVSTHLLLSLSGGRFLSLTDPPGYAQMAASRCESHHAHPILVGEPGSEDLLLASPIIMQDHPQIAPESPGDFFDATEIDEILALRTMTLSDSEKAEARATDPRAAALIDRVESLGPEAMERLHGAIRDFGPERTFGLGDRVRLRPGKRRTDAQDLLFAGCHATIEAVMQDVDGRDCLAVTIDDDPAAELHRWYGRFH
jgi:hypothetical protein